MKSYSILDWKALPGPIMCFYYFLYNILESFVKLSKVLENVWFYISKTELDIQYENLCIRVDSDLLNNKKLRILENQELFVTFHLTLLSPQGHGCPKYLSAYISQYKHTFFIVSYFLVSYSLQFQILKNFFVDLFLVTLLLGYFICDYNHVIIFKRQWNFVKHNLRFCKLYFIENSLKKSDAFSSIYCKNILYYFDEDMGVLMVRKGNLLVFT